MQKDTSEIVKELGLCPDFQTFYKENKEYMVSADLAQLLAELPLEDPMAYTALVCKLMK